MVEIGNIKFRHLLGREYDELARFLEQHPNRLADYVNNLVADLTPTSTADFVDAEHIYIIGLQHYNHFAPALLQRIDALIRSAAPERVFKIFLDATRPEPHDPVNAASARQYTGFQQSAARTYRQLNDSMGRVPFEEWQRRTRALMAQHQQFAERTGDADLLQRTGGALANVMLRAPNRYGIAGLQLAEELILECLRWKPFSGLHWNLWANVYFVSRDTKSAELILWESLKRIPYDAFNLSTLVEVLSRLRSFDLAIAALEDGIVYSPENPILWNQLSKLLIRTGDEADFEKLTRAATRSANLLPSHQNKVLLANIILSPVGKIKLSDDMRQFLSEIHRDEEWLADVGLIIAKRPNGQDYAERFFDGLTSLFQKSQRVANLFAKVVAAKGDQKALDRAIEICRRTIERLGDNVYSRMQLITYLTMKGDEVSIKEALQELNRREEDFGVDQYSRRLRQLISGEPLTAGDRSSLLQIPASTDRSPDKPQLLPQMDEQSHSHLQLPSSISISGELRKCEFVIRKISDPILRTAAKHRLKDIIATNPTFAYAQLLAERHADWVRSGVRLDTFPAAFERALRSRDGGLLTRLAAKNPKLEALCVVARSLYGDEAAFDQISTVLATIRGTEFPPLATLDRAMNPILTGTSGPINLAALPISTQEQVLQILYSANEASIM
jgi:tetratricopeptide (TPR) repeat protein